MIQCTLCDYKGHYLVPHLQDSHGLSEDNYSGTVSSPELLAATPKSKGRKAYDLSSPKVNFAGVELPVNLDVPPSACAAMPAGYVVPKHGRLMNAVQRTVVRVCAGNSKPIWVWGPPGTGKDAVFAALSARTRRPMMVFNIAPDVDIQAWLSTRAFSPTGTFWEEGPLLKALRDGYKSPSGRVVPYLIVLSDLDRASRSQMEPLRAILDSLGGRVQAPDGMHTVLPGTLVVATANTSGGGDTTGRYTSTPVDTSVLDRFTFKVHFSHMDARDEETILHAKYPALIAKHPSMLGVVMKSVVAIRDAIDKDDIYLDFGHRSVCNWLDAMVAEDACAKLDTVRMLKAGLQDILAGCPNDDTREAVKRLIDPHLKGGAVDEGDTRHISTNRLR